MALHHTLVVFDRPLSGATIPGRSSRYFSESEVAAVRVEAYQKGADSARHFADQQMVDFRAEVQALQDGLFAKLASAESLVISQLQDSLPGLVMEIARRLLGGYEPPPDAVARLCGEPWNSSTPKRTISNCWFRRATPPHSSNSLRPGRTVTWDCASPLLPPSARVTARCAVASV
jgi:flagellar assembly protein FliH